MMERREEWQQPGLGYFDDVDPDDALPVSRQQIVDYWTRRQRGLSQPAAANRTNDVLHPPPPVRPGTRRSTMALRHGVTSRSAGRTKDEARRSCTRYLHVS